MGQEITNTSFSKKDFRIFSSCLKQETKILNEWFEQGVLSNDGLLVDSKSKVGYWIEHLDLHPLIKSS